MTTARSLVVREDEDTFYHCISRCVRRAYLCGYDVKAGRDFSCRRQWVVNRLELAAESFAIEIYAYAVMENHFHVVLKTKVSEARTWTDREVVERWLRLYPHTRNDAGRTVGPSDEELAGILVNKEKIALWRSRLSQLGWVMKFVKERIARDANKEDKVSGAFWQGRFKSQLLADEGAVAACMAYVDLNPVRAQMAETPEESAFTSVAARARAKMAVTVVEASGDVDQPTDEQQAELELARQAIADESWLAPIESVEVEKELGCWRLDLEDYLALVDETGRRIRSDKRGAISPEMAPVLKRLDLSAEQWVESVQRYGGSFYLVAAKLRRLKDAASRVGRKWFCGQRPAVRMYVCDG